MPRVCKEEPKLISVGPWTVPLDQRLRVHSSDTKLSLNLVPDTLTLLTRTGSLRREMYTCPCVHVFTSNVVMNINIFVIIVGLGFHKVVHLPIYFGHPIMFPCYISSIFLIKTGYLQL